MDVKSIFASKTIWGAIIGIAPTVLGHLGLNAADATQAVGHAQTIVNDLVQAIGFGMVVYGRWTATKAVKLL